MNNILRIYTAEVIHLSAESEEDINKQIDEWEAQGWELDKNPWEERSRYDSYITYQARMIRRLLQP